MLRAWNSRAPRAVDADYASPFAGETRMPGPHKPGPHTADPSKLKRFDAPRVTPARAPDPVAHVAWICIEDWFECVRSQALAQSAAPPPAGQRRSRRHPIPRKRTR